MNELRGYETGYLTDIPEEIEAKEESPRPQDEEEEINLAVAETVDWCILQIERSKYLFSQLK